MPVHGLPPGLAGISGAGAMDDLASGLRTARLPDPGLLLPHGGRRAPAALQDLHLRAGLDGKMHHGLHGRLARRAAVLPGPGQDDVLPEAGDLVLRSLLLHSHYCPGETVRCTVQCPGHWICKRTWVPREEQRTIRCCHYVQREHCHVVNYTVCKTIPYTVMKQVPYTTCKMVPESHSQTLTYRRCYMVPEVRVQNIPYTTCRMVTQEHSPADLSPLLLRPRDARSADSVHDLPDGAPAAHLDGDLSSLLPGARDAHSADSVHDLPDGAPAAYFIGDLPPLLPGARGAVLPGALHDLPAGARRAVSDGHMPACRLVPEERVRQIPYVTCRWETPGVRPPGASHGVPPGALLRDLQGMPSRPGVCAVRSVLLALPGDAAASSRDVHHWLARVLARPKCCPACTGRCRPDQVSFAPVPNAKARPPAPGGLAIFIEPRPSFSGLACAIWAKLARILCHLTFPTSPR